MAQLESAYLTCVKSEFTLWPHKINKQANQNVFVRALQVTAVAFLIKLVYCWTMAAWPFVCSSPPPPNILDCEEILCVEKVKSIFP